MSSFKVPEPPYIAAGVLGGPFVIYLVTPLRNALTLGALNKSATALSLYGQVFSKGIRESFTGGAPMARAAVPGFLVLGPAFHMFKDLLGGSSAGAVALTALSESLIFYGAETMNAQVTYNQNALKHGTSQMPKLHNAAIPVGPGFGLHVTRNVLAMSGLRVFSAPCQELLGSTNPHMSPLTKTVLGDLIANVVVSAASAPLHQLFGWTVTVRQASGGKGSTGESTWVAATNFLKGQYLTSSGSISHVAGRDMLLRVIYNATIFTLYGAIERTLVSAWPTTLYW